LGGGVPPTVPPSPPEAPGPLSGAASPGVPLWSDLGRALDRGDARAARAVHAAIDAVSPDAITCDPFVAEQWAAMATRLVQGDVRVARAHYAAMARYLAELQEPTGGHRV
jgi:hypothetical protein